MYFKTQPFPSLSDLTRAVNALPRNMTSQMFNAIAAVTGQGQNPNTTPAQWASSQYGYSGGSSAGGGGSSSAYHVRDLHLFASLSYRIKTDLANIKYSFLAFPHFQGIRNAPAANGHTYDDAQLLVHHTWPAADHDHAPVSQQHTAVLTRTPSAFVLHSIIIILIIESADATAQVSATTDFFDASESS